MDFARLFERLQRSVNSITSHNPAWLLGGVVAVLSLAGLAAVQTQPESPTYEELFVGERLTQNELHRIEAALGKAELTSYSVLHGTLQVPRSERGTYLAALQDANAMPQDFHSPTHEALTANSLLENPRLTTKRMEFAREQDARNAICKITSIEEAFVYFDEKVDRSLRAGQHMTAVAGVRTRNNQHLDLPTARMIQEMLLGIKAGLKSDNITINVVNTGQSFRGAIGVPGTPEARLLTQQRLEQQWKHKLTTALSFVPDSNVNVVVEPNSDGATAREVRVSVALAASDVRCLSQLSYDAPISDETLTEFSEQIRTAIVPLLPVSAQSEQRDLVAVTLVHAPGNESVTAAPWAASRLSPWFVGAMSLAVGACLAFLLMSGKQQEQTETAIRLYDSKDGNDVDEDANDEPTESAIQLRAYVEEDPDAVARSLSDFIDRAS